MKNFIFASLLMIGSSLVYAVENNDLSCECNSADYHCIQDPSERARCVATHGALAKTAGKAEPATKSSSSSKNSSSALEN